MKQDEIRNEILPHCLNGTHADYASEKIMNLLSKQKPSVSDEEIKDWADYTYPDIDKETDVYLRRGFFCRF